MLLLPALAPYDIDVLYATPRQPATGRVTRSAARSGPSTLPAPLSSASPTKDKGKKRKLGEEEEEDRAYQDRHDLTAQSLVQQVTCNPMPVKIKLM